MATVELEPAADFPMVQKIGHKGKRVVVTRGIQFPYVMMMGWSSDCSRSEYFAVINGTAIPLLEMIETGCISLDPNRFGDPYNQRYLLVSWPMGEETVGERSCEADYIMVKKTVGGVVSTPTILCR